MSLNMRSIAAPPLVVGYGSDPAFGYPTFWVNRQKQSLEQLDAIPDAEGTGMSDLLSFLAR